MTQAQVFFPTDPSRSVNFEPIHHWRQDLNQGNDAIFCVCVDMHLQRWSKDGGKVPGVTCHVFSLQGEARGQSIEESVWRIHVITSFYRIVFRHSFGLFGIRMYRTISFCF